MDFTLATKASERFERDCSACSLVWGRASLFIPTRNRRECSYRGRHNGQPRQTSGATVRLVDHRSGAPFPPETVSTLRVGKDGCVPGVDIVNN